MRTIIFLTSMCVFFLSSRPSCAAVSASRIPETIGHSVLFERSVGEPKASYIGKGRDYRVLLTPTDVIFRAGSTCKIYSPSWSRVPSTRWLSCSRNSEVLVDHLSWRGTNSHIQPEGRGNLSSYSSYFIGNDPQKWQMHVSQFSEVWYPHIYPGIDLVYYGHKGRLEYDLVVSPGANPNQIRFAVNRPDKRSGAHLSADGDLVLSNADRELVFRRPLFYQGKSCSREYGSYSEQSGCKKIDGGGFRLHHGSRASGLFSFRIPEYDHSQPLIIDPAVLFSTYLGGSAGDGVDSLVVDSKGYIYLYGDTSSFDFPVTSGAYQTHLASPPDAGSTDAFVTKLSPDGSQILWSTYLGGSNSENPKGIAIDAADNVWVTGQTWSNDFPVISPFQAQTHSYATGYVSKLSADGSKLLYSTYLGGSSMDFPFGLVLDANEEPIVTGVTDSFDFPVVNALQPSHGAGISGDAFITKFSADGSSLVFSTYLGGPNEDDSTGIALDPSGNIYVAGTAGTGFPTTPGGFQPACVSTQYVCSFIAKISASGQTLSYSTYLSDALIAGIAVNSSGNAFVTGDADSAFQTTPGAFQPHLGGGGLVKDPDAFVTEMDPTGTSTVYSTYLGGGSYEHGYAITLDSANNAYVTGQTDSPDFPLQAPLQTIIYGGVPAVFVSEFNNAGSALLFSTFWAGGAPGYGGQQGIAIAVDGLGNIIAAGSTLTPDFPVVNPIQSELLGPGDAFIAKFEFTPDFRLEASPTSVTVAPGNPANYTLTLMPLNGFNQQITLTCSGAPVNSTCSVSPSTLTLDGSNTVPANVSVTTMARSGAAMIQGAGIMVTLGHLNSGIALLLILGPLTLFFYETMVRGRFRWVLALAVAGVALFVSCGGGGSNGGGGGGGTPPGSYTLTVSANGGSLNRDIKLGLVVSVTEQ